MYLSSSPEKNGAEPCLRCSSAAVLTRPSIVFTWQNLRILAQKGQALWGTLRLEFEKSNFQAKRVCNMTMKPDRNPAALKNNSGSENLSHKPKKFLGACPQHATKHAARIPVMATELKAGPGAEQLCQCLVCSKGNMPWFQGRAHLPSGIVLYSIYRWVWGLLWNFGKGSIGTLAYFFTQRVSFGTWKGRISFSGTTGQYPLSLNVLLTDCFVLCMLFRGTHHKSILKLKQK